MWPHSPLRLLIGTFLTCSLYSAGSTYAYEVWSYAAVNENGTLRITGKTVKLFGIYIPDTERTCSTNWVPPVCGSRAYVALEFKIHGFVHCELLVHNADRTYTGLCRVNVSAFDEGEDLSAYLLQKGWAVALPDAPFEYHTLEKIARHRNLGVWGIPVDRILNRK